MDEGIVPDDWRFANVSPIYKKGSRSQVSNYRPASLTSQVCKVFEAIVRDDIMEHLLMNKLVRSSHHGFLWGRSCLSNLLTFLDKVTELVDHGYAVDAIYLDFAKAFDKVPYVRLMHKVRAHGIRGLVGNWIENWLSGRQQKVCVECFGSPWAYVTSGVSHGSVLGPCRACV